MLVQRETCYVLTLILTKYLHSGDGCVDYDSGDEADEAVAQVPAEADVVVLTA